MEVAAVLLVTLAQRLLSYIVHVHDCSNIPRNWPNSADYVDQLFIVNLQWQRAEWMVMAES